MDYKYFPVPGNGQDPILGGGNEEPFDEEPIGRSDQQPEMVNATDYLPILAAMDKEKQSWSHRRDDQDRPRTKTRCIEDGYPNITDGLRLLVIFNYYTVPFHEERKGSERDVDSLTNSFTNLNFEVSHFKNLSSEETLNQLKMIQMFCNQGSAHMVVIAFMSHGDGIDGDGFLARDGKSVPMKSVRRMFSNSNCKGLQGKPKIFLGHFCRGICKSNQDVVDQTSSAAKPESTTAVGPEISESVSRFSEYGQAEFNPDIENIANFLNTFDDNAMEIDGKPGSDIPSVFKPDDLEDMTTIYSCKLGQKSYRHHNRGSVSIQSLCQVLDQNGKTHPLTNLYCSLQKEMKQRQIGDSFEYCFSPDRDDMELKTCFFSD